jgi:hypothetical protein
MATSNFALLQLSGSDTAGYNSINSLITDIDNKLYARVAVPGMIMVFQGGAAPTGWADYTSSMSGSGVTLPAGHIWIRKSA